MPSFVEIGPMVLEKNFKFHQCIFAITLKSKGGFFGGGACLVEFGPVVLEEKILKFRLCRFAIS